MSDNPPRRTRTGADGYSQLPLHVRRYLESMTPEQCEVSQTFVRRPKKVQDWLLNLTEEDVACLNKLKAGMQSATIVSRFLRIIILGMLLTLGTMATAGNHIITLFKTFFGK